MLYGFYLRFTLPLLLALGLFCSGFAQPTNGLPIIFNTYLSGDQMLPTVATTAHAKATAILVNNLLMVTGDYADLSSEIFGQDTLRRVGLTGVVIHRSTQIERATVVRAYEEVYPGLPTLSLLNDGGTTGQFFGVFKLNEAQVQELKDGLYFIIIHTKDYPRGEISGQLLTNMKLELSSTDLVGFWQIQASPKPLYLVFKDSGNFSILVDLTNNTSMDSGEYSLVDTTLSFTSDATASYCPDAIGKYTVMLTEQDHLRFFLLNDSCLGRLRCLRASRFMPLVP